MSIKILLADDSITIQKVVGIIFGGSEYSLTVVDNGKAAIEKARELNPDVLLIDALMPGMSGYEVCEAVRATPSLSTKPILLLTGSFEPFDETKATNCGANDFLTKPFESQQIIAKVKKLIELDSSHKTPIGAAAQTSVIPPPVPPVEHGDIWGAFTAPKEPDVPPAIPVHAEDRTGSQWIPVEEETFSFEEETPDNITAPAFNSAKPGFGNNMLGEIDFGAVAAPTAVTKPAHVFEQQTAPAVSPAVPAIPATLTEEQLRDALSAVSKEVIERIVWEVVPDLAEVLIKEAIRKIKEGQ